MYSSSGSKIGQFQKEVNGFIGAKYLRLGWCDIEKKKKKTIFDIDIEKILIILSISIFAVVLSQDDIVSFLNVDAFWNIYDNIIKNMEILP